MKTQINEIQRMQQLAGILNENTIEEISPQVRNSAAAKAANKVDSSDSKLVRSKAFRQHSTFAQLPKHLQRRGEELAKKISDSMGAISYNYVLKKVVRSADFVKPHFIHYRIDAAKKDKNGITHSLKPFTIDVEKDKFEEFQDNPSLPSDLSSALLAFIKKLQAELQ